MKSLCSGRVFGQVDCYVLADGRRVISQRGAVRGLTQKPGETSGREGGNLAAYVERLPNGLALLEAGAEIRFQGPTGPAIGRDAEWFVDVLAAYADAADAGLLHHTQAHLAVNANRILRSLAKVGIVALIDEASGYQSVRKEGVLAALFARVFPVKPQPWDAMFQPSLVKALASLDGYVWNGGPHPRHLASTNKKIYVGFLGGEVAAELRRRNPDARFGHNLHQDLSDDVRDAFRSHLDLVEVVAKQSRSKNDFWNRMERQFGGAMLQLDLDPEFA